jgi:hypothetical protein
MSITNISEFNFDSQKNHWRGIFAELEEKEEQECSDVYESLIFWQKELEKFNNELDFATLQASGQTLKEFGVNRDLYLDDMITNRIKTLERVKEQLESGNSIPLGHTKVAHYVLFLHKIGLIESLQKVTKTNTQTARLIQFLGNYPESTYDNIRITLTDLRESKNKKFFNPTNIEKVDDLIRKYTNIEK